MASRKQSRSRFHAATVVGLRMDNVARRLEIRLADAAGREHVVSLPIPAATELAAFISDACSFVQQSNPRPSARRSARYRSNRLASSRRGGSFEESG